MVERGEQVSQTVAQTTVNCPACSEENSRDARFCQRCGTQLPDYQEPVAQTVTQVRAVTVATARLRGGADVTERSRRHVRSKIRGVFERHGAAARADEDGLVVAVFGSTAAHGNGALRAARAAAEIRDEIADLQAPLFRAGEPEVSIAIGLAIEQVLGDAEAAPIEAALALADVAADGEVLLSSEAHRLAGPASVEAEPSRSAESGATPDDQPREQADEEADASSSPGPDDVDPLEALESALVDEDEEQDDEGSPPEGSPPEGSSDDAPAAPASEDDLSAVDSEEQEPPMRLLSVVSAVAGQAPSVRSPIVGRDVERVALRELFERAIEERACLPVVVLGSPGVGKTRLAEALIGWAQESHDATAIRIRCRDASEGGAAWPLADLVEQAIGAIPGDSADEVRAALQRAVASEPDSSSIVERLSQILALPDGRAIVEETAWAIRRLLEAVARVHPVIVHVDDGDGADASFARFLRTATSRIGGAVVLLASGRSDPLHGTAGQEGVMTITLEPLDRDGVAELVEHLVGRTAFGERAQQRVAAATGGNPFLVEQLTFMLIDEGLLSWDEGRWIPTTDLSTMPTPPNVAALLDARLQGLGAEERVVLERLAVAGDRIPWDAVEAVVPEDLRRSAGDHVGSLVRKQLLRISEVPGDDTVELCHVFVREAAARSASSQVRATVMAASARYLEASAGDRSDRYDEGIGAALERAFRAHSGLGTVDETTRQLARQAADRLDAAGARAADLGDANGGFQLAQRASSLIPRDDARRPELLLRAALALGDLGQHARADALLTETAHAARAAGERGAEWRAKVLRARIVAESGSERTALETARRRADRSIAVFRELGDDWGLAWAWSLSAYVHLCRGHASAYATSAGLAAQAARRAGKNREEANALRDLVRALGDGPAPLEEVASRLAGIVDRHGDEFRVVGQEALGVLAMVQADRGRLDEARAADDKASTIVADLGLDRDLAVRGERSGTVRMLVGDVEGAEHDLREGLDLAERADDDATTARIAAALAHVLEDRGNYGDAVRLTEIAEQHAPMHDIVARVRWRTARARALAHGGSLSQANVLAREAVRLADQTDHAELRATALVELAEVLRLTGRRNEAVPLVRRALRAFTRKGADVRAARARRLLEELDPANDPERDGRAPEPDAPGGDAGNARSGGVPSTSAIVEAPSVEYAQVASDPGLAVGGMPKAPDVPADPSGPGSDSAVTPTALAGLGQPLEDPFRRELSALNPDEPVATAQPDPQDADVAPSSDEGEKVKGRKGIRFW
ncbi:MAG: AAA family ATPase [Actinomycetota bacterium]